MKTKFFEIIFLFFSFFIFLKTSSAVDEKIITVLYPPDKTAMEFNVLSITLNIQKGAANLVKVNVNNEEKTSTVLLHEVISFPIKLSVGINKIDIFALKDGKGADTVSISLFRKSNLIAAFKDPPAGYKKYSFHQTDNPACLPCHKLEPNETDLRIFTLANTGEKNIISAETSATSSCYSCHKGIISFPSVHNQGFAWGCLYCHDWQASPKYKVIKMAADLCFFCHKKQKELWNSRKYIHGPVNTGNCAICHNPHASDNQYQLEQPTWNLCINCHIEKESGKHVVSGFSSDSHPTKGKPDPINIGKELSCASCHNPHASDSSKLWQENARSAYALCVKCHDK